MHYIGIDIGSTTSKMIVMDQENNIVLKHLQPTGWSSVDVANQLKDIVVQHGIDVEDAKVVATGYGRVSVGFADKTLTEISCHGKGAAYLFGKNDSTVIDIGGQDIKIISLSNGMVTDFLMNDKCSAGTGRFLEVMSNIMGIRIPELCELARSGQGVSISSMCTVFAESEVISLIGAGTRKEDIAYGVIESITDKVKTMCGKHAAGNKDIYLTGGLHQSTYIVERLSAKVGVEVKTNELAQYAGALGASISAQKLA